jgi:hypothetical protein
MRGRRRTPATFVSLLAFLALLAATSCAVHGLDFRTDDRVSIVSPSAEATVTLPVTLRWTAKSLPSLGQQVGGHPTQFAIFIDRQPIRPGQTFRAVADDQCRATPGCPDPSWLAQRYIFTTTATSLRLDSVPADNKGDRFGRGHGHEATIVLVDGSGHRIGEAAYAVDFFLRASP